MTAKTLLGRRTGLTLIEVVAVAAMIGIVGAIIIPAILKSNAKARRIMCIANQRAIYGAAARYEFEQGATLRPLGQKARLDILLSSGYIESRSSFGCPANYAGEYDDYILAYEGDTLADVNCEVYPLQHDWR